VAAYLFLDLMVIILETGVLLIKSQEYTLNSKNGNVIHREAKGKWGDFDVNGVLIIKRKIYFGNDNEEFICYDLDGDILWKYTVSSDIESEPVIFDIKGNKAIVYATELVEVKAVNCDNGESIGSNFSE